MSYLGQVELKSSEIRRIDVTGSTSATHTLTWTPASEQSLIITINGIKQQNNYSISGVTLTLDDALLSADAMEVVGILDIGEAVVPPDDSISTAKIQDDAVTAAKLANSINTEIAANTAKTGITSGQASAITANTAKVTNATHTGDVTGATSLTIAVDAVDIAMLSATGSASASTFLRGDNAWATVTAADNTPSFKAKLSVSQAIPNATWTKVQMNTEVWDTDGTYDNSTNYRFTVPVGSAGKYSFHLATQVGVASGDYSAMYIYINGSEYSPSSNRLQATGWTSHVHQVSIVVELSEADYVEWFFAHDYGSDRDLNAAMSYFSGYKLAGV